MASLNFTEGPKKGSNFLLGEHNLIMLGRDSSCSIQIMDSKLSRHHLQIAWNAADGCHEAIDFNSHNGVYVNGDRIDKKKSLADGDVIDIGSSRVLYTDEDNPDARRLNDVSKKFGQRHIHTQIDSEA
ncbi:MAG: FHA domain-containing protein [Planctomycetota bacterium]